MEAFSFRRMMLFCRLQMVEMYGRNIGRTLRVGAAAVLVICLFSLIFGEEGESVSVAERMMVACSFVASVAFFSDLVAYRMMVPASPAEKYVSVFVSSLLLSVMFLALSVLVGSAFFTLLSFFNEPSLTLLYFREGFDASGLVGGDVHAAADNMGSAVFQERFEAQAFQAGLLRPARRSRLLPAVPDGPEGSRDNRQAVGAHRDRVRLPAADADIHCAVVQAVQEA